MYIIVHIKPIKMSTANNEIRRSLLRLQFPNTPQ